MTHKETKDTQQLILQLIIMQLDEVRHVVATNPVVAQVMLSTTMAQLHEFREAIGTRHLQVVDNVVPFVPKERV